MDQNTPNLKLPYIAPGQAQKHVTHNEAIRQLDALVQLSVKDIVTSDPSSPHNGERYLINNDARGNFAGKDHHLAAFQDGAWTFIECPSAILKGREVMVFSGKISAGIIVNEITLTIVR